MTPSKYIYVLYWILPTLSFSSKPVMPNFTNYLEDPALFFEDDLKIRNPVSNTTVVPVGLSNELANSTRNNITSTTSDIVDIIQFYVEGVLLPPISILGMLGKKEYINYY